MCAMLDPFALFLASEKANGTCERYDHPKSAASPREVGHANQVFFNATDSTMLATSSHRSVAVSIVS